MWEVRKWKIRDNKPKLKKFDEECPVSDEEYIEDPQEDKTEKDKDKKNIKVIDFGLSNYYPGKN